MRLLGPIVLALLSLSACGGFGPTEPADPVDDNSIRLVVGDDVFVTGDPVRGGELANVRRVAAPTSAPVDVIHLRLAKEDNPGGPASVLTVDDFFESPFGFQGVTETSTNVFYVKDACSVTPGISYTEQLQDSATAFVFQRVAFMAPGTFCQ